MTLRVPEPTEESVEAVTAHLSELAARTNFRHRALNRANPASLALAAPHDVYSLGLTDLTEGASLDAATVTGRRFLVMDGQTPIASAELADQDKGAAFQANEGPYVEATAVAIARAEADPELANHDYEVRVLRIPALYFMGLWLKNEQGEADVLIPLDPAPAPLEAGRKYTPTEALSALAEPARERLEVDDVGDTPPSATR
jgi:hypothetical protein